LKGKYAKHDRSDLWYEQILTNDFATVKAFAEVTALVSDFNLTSTNTNKLASNEMNELAILFKSNAYYLVSLLMIN
jgi:hypothetical protein